MTKLIIATFVITIIPVAFLIYDEAVIGRSGLDPASIFIIFVLSVYSLLSLISLVLYRTNKREAAYKIWLPTISLFLSYLFVDLVAGFFFITPLSPRMIRDDQLHHRMKPNTFTRYESPDFEYIQRVNSIGLRGPDIELKKKPNTYRVLMLGDSFTMGKGVGDDETSSVLLEASLNGSNSTNNIKAFEVINAGVDSYAPILSFLQLKEIGPLIEPDLVVFNFDMSDLLQEAAYRYRATFGANGDIIGVSAPKDYEKRFMKEISRGWIDQNLFFGRLILFYIEKWAADPNEVTIRNTVSLVNPRLLKHTLVNDNVDRTQQWQNVFDSILNIKKYCDDHYIEFLLTIYPWGHQVNENEWVPGRNIFIPNNARPSMKTVHVIQDFSATSNIKLLNVFSAFHSYNGKSPLYHKYDMHWTTTGHKIMARELHKFIEAMFLKNPK